jgi:formyl-CoA transferase
MRADVPAGRIYNVADIANDPQYKARNMILEIDHSHLGPVKVPGIVPKLSKTPGSIEWLGPEMGTHNLDVYRGIGLSDAQIDALKELGVI